ncbi:MAG: pyridine nucleotide-disulfide oxidoreductase [Novosphingobium sp.]|uniref:pyridine nucleotide-disulfide oxidoreductase n=1 Tax=Novosphingobium sp. TaxID=1874826 RepID=UPI00301B1B87
MDASAKTSGDDPLRIAAGALRPPLADLAVAAAALAVLRWGWLHRADPALDPQAWPGYLMGLGGALAMLMVLGFSLRKRARTGRVPVSRWYNAHILLGLSGAVAVVIHARFAWGSINSSFALAATLLVVASGLVARYLLGPARRSGNRWLLAPAEAWHYLHVPPSLVLVPAVIVHVYMAHAY